MVRKSLVIALLVVSFVACSRTPEPSELRELVSAAPSVLNFSQPGDIHQTQWPDAIARFKPERVYATPDGLYVVTSSFFVEEEGLFVPRSADFAPQPGTDPSYTSLGTGVFSYRIKG
jgi:hypothetical protein